MIQTEFYINGNIIELADDSLVAMSYVVNDIAEIKDRNADFSNIFKAPRTAKNDIALQYCAEVSSTSKIPYRYGDARIVQGGVTILPIGIAEVRGYDDFFYQIKVLAGNATFFRQLGTKKLSELDLTAFDHTFNFATVTGSFANDWTDGYKYPLINYGRLTQARNVRVDYQRPAFFAKAVLNQIFSETSYTGGGDFLNSFEITRLLIPFANDKLLGPPTASLNKTNLAPQTWSGSLPIFFYTGGRFNQNIGTGRSYYGPAYEGDYTFRFSAHYENLTGAVPTIRILVRRAGVDIILDVLDFAREDFVNGITNGVFTFDKTYHLKAGDQLSIDITAASGAFQIFGYPGGAFPIDPDSFFECIEATNLVNVYGTAGNGVSAALNLPNWTQADFFKLLAQMYGIVYTTNPLTKVVYFQQFKDLYTNKPRSLDWTEKIDFKSCKIEYKIGSYGQDNALRYKEDSGDFEFVPRSADGSILIDDTTLPITKDLYTLLAAATYEGFYLGDIRIPVIRKQKPQGLPDEPALSISTVNRLLYDFPVQASDVSGAGIVFTDLTSTVTPAGANPVPFCYFQHPPAFPGIGITSTDEIRYLNYQNLIADNFLELGIMLNDLRFLKVNANVTAPDIENLNHFIPIYLKQFAAYFYLNKIDRFVNDGRLTNIQLIRL